MGSLLLHPLWLIGVVPHRGGSISLILADKIIFGLVNRHMLCDSDFEEAETLCRFTEAGRRKVVESFREKIDLEQLDDVRGYRTIVLREAFHLQAHVLGMMPYKAYKQKA
jgi:CRISP-associated protein Cas1